VNKNQNEESGQSSAIDLHEGTSEVNKDRRDSNDLKA
jgi:hypothetical protein